MAIQCTCLLLGGGPQDGAEVTQQYPPAPALRYPRLVSPLDATVAPSVTLACHLYTLSHLRSMAGAFIYHYQGVST